MSIASSSQNSWLSWFAIWRIGCGKYGLRRTLLLAFLALGAAVIAYGLTYRLSLQLAVSVTADPFKGVQQHRIHPMYSIAAFVPPTWQHVVHHFFTPAHQLDRWWRPDFWTRAPERMSIEDQDEVLADIARGATPEEIRMLEERVGRPIPVASSADDSDESTEH